MAEGKEREGLGQKSWDVSNSLRRYSPEFPRDIIHHALVKCFIPDTLFASGFTLAIEID